MPQLLVSTATALTSWERQRITKDVRDRRGPADRKRAEASLRFVHFAGFWSHYTPGRQCSSWPLPWPASLADLPDFAERHGGLAPNPQDGDVVLLASLSGAGRHSHAGIVVAVERAKTMLNGRPAFVCLTAEGEVHGPVGSPRMSRVRLVRRRLSAVFGDCFIRWCDLPVRLSPAGVDGIPAVRYELPEKLLTFTRRRRARAA